MIGRAVCRRFRWPLLGLAILLWLGAAPGVVEAKDGEFGFIIDLNESKPQLAVWLEDEKGRFVDTVYVTRKIGRRGMGNRGGGIDDRRGGSRVSSLPVWANRRGRDHEGNPYPTRNRPLPDAVSSASPRAGRTVYHWRPEKPLPKGRYDFFVEVNESFDQNDYHDYSWYRGQPSVVWKGSLTVDGQNAEAEARIVGHGHPAGQDGSIDPDTSTLTSALELIDGVRAEYKPD